MSLRTHAHAYLEAEDYSVNERSGGLLVGTRGGVGGREHIYVWVPQVKRGIPHERLMADFGTAYKEQPSARKFVLVESREGIRGDFPSDAKKYFGVSINTPAQFFDTTFRDEDASRSVSVPKKLRDRGHGLLPGRVQQPYSDLATGEDGDDLLPVLSQALRSRDLVDRPIHIVIGPAGVGKSFLFEGLFAQLYDEFQSDKRSQVPSRRPLPLVPEFLDFASDPTLNAILDAFLSTEFSRRLNPSSFTWKLTHGYGSWLIDGLDEIIARDTGLFDWIQSLVTVEDPPSSPTVLICLRDSVVSTNGEFREFLSDMDDYLNVYQLSTWGAGQKRTFAAKALGERANDFVGLLEKDETLDGLADLPYYAYLLSEQFRSGALTETTGPVDLLEGSLEGILEREESKDLIDPRFISTEQLRELLEGIAAENMERQFAGVDVDTLAEWVQLVAPEDVPFEDRERLIVNLIHLAVFASGEHGRVRFAQELLERYLLGSYFVDLFDRNRSAFAGRLGAVQIPPDWLTMQVLTRHVLDENRLGEIVALAYETQHDPVAFKNLIQLASSSSEDGKVIQDLGYPIEGLDLSGIRFEGLDLSNLSMRGCNLSDAEFIDCRMTDVALEGAVLRNTRFALEKGSMEGATIGDLSTFHSIRVNGATLVTDFEAARDWFAEQTAEPVRTLKPCPSALQLRHMIGKYVYPNGEARRAALDERAIVAGKKYVDNVQELADGLVRHGYLDVTRRGRYERPGGDQYAELVAYAKNMSVSQGLKLVLNDHCDLSGCAHSVKSVPAR